MVEPEEPIRRHGEQHASEERVPAQVERGTQALPHRLLGGGPGIGLPTQIHHRQRPVAHGRDDLPGPVGSVHHPHPQRLGLRQRPPDRCLQPRGVHRARDLQVLPALVGGAERGELLGMPDAQLRGGQRQFPPLAAVRRLALIRGAPRGLAKHVDVPFCSDPDMADPEERNGVERRSTGGG
ncbi:hypothetical protein GCM10022420_064230 [Streptomyces iranensis]